MDLKIENAEKLEISLYTASRICARITNTWPILTCHMTIVSLAKSSGSYNTMITLIKFSPTKKMMTKFYLWSKNISSRVQHLRSKTCWSWISEWPTHCMVKFILWAENEWLALPVWVAVGNVNSGAKFSSALGVGIYTSRLESQSLIVQLILPDTWDEEPSWTVQDRFFAAPISVTNIIWVFVLSMKQNSLLRYF